jgi:hypothetical protein
MFPMATAATEGSGLRLRMVLYFSTSCRSRRCRSSADSPAYPSFGKRRHSKRQDKTKQDSTTQRQHKAKQRHDKTRQASTRQRRSIHKDVDPARTMVYMTKKEKAKVLNRQNKIRIFIRCNGLKKKTVNNNKQKKEPSQVGSPFARRMQAECRSK